MFYVNKVNKKVQTDIINGYVGEREKERERGNGRDRERERATERCPLPILFGEQYVDDDDDNPIEVRNTFISVKPAAADLSSCSAPSNRQERI